MQKTYVHTKLVSVPTLMVLLIAGIAGFILVSPAPAHAAGPTIFLSATSGTPGTKIDITGQGFANGAVITIKSTVGTATVDWFGGAGSSTVDSLTTDTPALITTAAGDFNTMPMIPDMPGGAQTVTVSDGTSTATATITITPSLTLTTTVGGDTDAFASGYPEQVSTVTATVHGFGASESVTISNTGIFSSFSPSLATSTLGTATSTVSATVADSPGGSKNVVATGQTSSLTASVSFKIMPWVSFYNSQGGGTTFSFLGKAPTSVLVEGHGFTPGTIAGNSITVGGVATTSSAVTVGSDGTFGMGTHLVVAPNTDVPFGQVSVVVQGTTFNLANGNINQWNAGGSGGPILGGVFISSIIGTTSSTAVAMLNAAGYGYGDTPVALGYGFVAGGPVVTANANGALTGVTLGHATNTIETTAGVADANGAIFVSTTSGSFGDKVPGSYTATFTQASGVANVISPSFTVKQVLTLSFDTSTHDGTGTIDFQDTGLTLSVHGFTASTTVTVTAGGATLNTATITTDTTGKALAQAVTNPDLAWGSYNATATDGTYSATDTFATIPMVAPGAGSTMTVLSGGAGTVSSLRTVTGVSPYGVHGLKANTAYDINWGMVQTTGKNVIGSFTSTAAGGIPLPGVQITIPAGSAGNHLITIIDHATGNDALFNTVDNGITANIDAETQEVMSQYGDLVFTESITAIATPTVVNVGQAFSLSGTGLFGATTYFTTITTTSGTASGQLYSQFTTSAAGSIPAGSSITFPSLSALPTGTGSCTDSTAYPEKATNYYVHLSQASQIGGGGQDGQALVILSANAVTNSSTVAAGRSVTLTANGLCPSQAYNVIFNYATNGVTFTGQTVSAFVTNVVGSGSGVFTVTASTAPMSYVVQLQRLGPTTLLGVLNVAPTLTVTGGSVGTCNTTSCFTLSGSATKTTLGSLTGISATFSNAASSSVTGIVYAVVHNSIGQTVYYTTATISPSASGTANAFLVLSGLPAGTYSVQLFATDTSGNAISVSTTTSVTLP